jgi:hypothetical protein
MPRVLNDGRLQVGFATTTSKVLHHVRSRVAVARERARATMALRDDIAQCEYNLVKFKRLASIKRGLGVSMEQYRDSLVRLLTLEFKHEKKTTLLRTLKGAPLVISRAYGVDDEGSLMVRWDWLSSSCDKGNGADWFR